ncbi:hypothetical protein SAMN05443633_102389 [Chryseobacterium arachidis]|uniref:Uncharacterized protein n=2 Tax=Chryseobacterium arachidis TaxID=1416778 RepID=A0A1M4XPP9_9FLAO|nr:hypothetical protein [Chryseobacterium arachidis]SHE95479.1 hypothetical protein SAMN05443633_102389 [Chryseobacterium arachidis]
MNYEDFDTSDPEQLKLLSLVEINKNFLLNQKINGIEKIKSLQNNTNKSFEDISRKTWAQIRGKRVEEITLEDFFGNENLNVEQLIKDLDDRSTYFISNKFDFTRYNTSGEALQEFKKEKGIPPMAKSDNLVVRDNNYTLEVVHRPEKQKINSEELTNVSESLFLDSLKKALIINTSIDYITKSKYTHTISIDINNKSIIYEFYICYSQADFIKTNSHPTSVETTVNIDDKYKAIGLRTDSYNTFLRFINRVYGEKAYNNYKVILFKRFEQLANSLGTIEQLKFFYDKVPDFIITGFDVNGENLKLSDEILWKHFMLFMDYDDKLSQEDKKNAVMWSLPAQDFRDESSYAIRILTGIKGNFILNKLLPDPELVLRIYSNMDGQSEYKGRAFVMNGSSNSYGNWIDNKTIFVAIITAHLQDHEQDSKIKIPYTENIETDFFQGTDLIDKQTNYKIEYSLDSHIFYKESGEHKNKIYLENRMREWIPYGNVDADIGVQTVGEWDDEVTFTESYYNPLEIVTFSQYMDHDDIETGDVLENCIISNVPALFVKHASDLKEWQKVHQMIRIGTDVLMILGSIATIESGASGMILYAAVADLGLATADLTIQGGLKQNLERTTEGREFLEEWDNFYNIATFATAGPVIVKAIEKKIPQIMEKAVPIFHSFKLQALPAEKFSNILLKSVYSLNIKGFCKSGLQLVRYRKCAVEFGQLYKGAFRLQDAGLLFIKNIKGDVSTIYKGIVLKSGSKEEVGNFINNILNKVRGRKKIEVYLDKLIKTLRETEDYSSIFAKTVSSVEDGVTKIIKDFEKEIIAKKITKEDGLLVNNARNIKQRHVGEKFPDYIVWDNIPSTYFKGSKITHFHPNGSGLSLADIWMFITCELLEIRAFGPTGTVYSMKNLGLPDKVVEELWDMIQMQEVLGASLNEGKAFKQLWKKMEPYVEYSKYVNK